VTAALRHHLPTAAAAGVVAVIVGDVIHEMLGHGAGCLLGGGIPAAWSTSWSLCRGIANDVVRNVPFQLGGNTLNVLAGAAALTLSRRASRGADAWFLWCLGAVQLCAAGAYLLFDPLTGVGDFGPALRAVAPAAAVAIGVTLLGALVLAVAMPVAARRLGSFVSPGAARAEAWKLVLLPWLLGSLAVMCVTAWMWASLFPQFLVAGLWFHAGCAGFMLLVPLFMRPADATAARTIQGSPLYLAIGAGLAVVSYVRLGAGIAYPW
jgi:hypothetical protein